MTVQWWGWCLVALGVVFVAHFIAVVLLCIYPVHRDKTEIIGAPASLSALGGTGLTQAIAGFPNAGGTSSSTKMLSTKKADATFFTSYFQLEGMDDEFSKDHELVPMFASDHMKTQ
jgi:hypothetical protein